MDKKELRKIIKDRKRQYSSRQLEELSLSVLSRLDSNPHLQNAQTILMYYSLPDEVDTHHYIDQLVSRGKRVILPVVLDDTNMELREYSGVQDLKEGAYHILEPKGALDIFRRKQWKAVRLRLFMTEILSLLISRIVNYNSKSVMKNWQNVKLRGNSRNRK